MFMNAQQNHSLLASCSKARFTMVLCNEKQLSGGPQGRLWLWWSSKLGRLAH